MRQTENEYVYLVGKSKRRRPLGRPNYRRDGEINMDTKETEWQVDSFGLG
jgi:hypothetical protein